MPLLCLAPSCFADEQPIETANASSEHFTLLAVSIENAHAIPLRDFAPDYENDLTRQVSIEDVNRIADAVTERYRRQGYFLSRAIVPPQQLETGIVHLTIIEGRFDAVRIEGKARREVAPIFEGLDHEPIANLHDLDSRLARASDLPGIAVKAHIEPNLNDPAKHTLVLRADIDHVSGYSSLDNRGTRDMGPLQLYSRISVNSALADRDQFSLSGFTLPENSEDFAYGEAAYSYLFASGFRVGASVSAAKAHDGQDSLSEALGSDRSGFNITLEEPLIRTRHAGLWLSAAYDSLHLEGDFSGGGAYADDVRAVRLRLRGFLSENGRATSAFAQVSYGSRSAFGGSDQEPGRRTRWDADNNFTKFNARLTHFQPIGRYFGLFGAIDGQWTEGPLLASEEYVLGGASFGRAYDAGELTGDRAIAGSLELRAGFDPAPEWISFAQAYLFADAGKVWNFNAPLDDNASVSSAGGGFRLTLFDHVSAEFELARPLSRIPINENSRAWRQFFSLSAIY